MTTQKINSLVRKFSHSIEMNKDRQAYSDFKEGVNKGLDIARYTFEENANKFSLPGPDEDGDVKAKDLQDDFSQLLDEIVLTKKPNCSEERLDGIYTGFERSKKIFKDFLQEALPVEN
ncbi:hypothetical protein RSJ42_11805 [Methanosarcina hadiensis]|uniref:hypothetical protein n=1 Tax=Methanosarcina hadiensis TaxID=3078083 RepID=UPI003977ACC2